MADGGERWLRPSAGTLLRACVRGIGHLWLLLGTACAVMWWHYGILDNNSRTRANPNPEVPPVTATRRLANGPGKLISLRMLVLLRQKAVTF